MTKYKIIIKSLVIILNIWATNAFYTVFAQSQNKILKFGFYASIVHEGNISELDESFRHWVNAVQKNSSIEWFSKALIKYRIYNTKMDLVNDIKNHNINFMNLSSLDFFALNLQNVVVPLLTTAKRLETKFEKYLLVTNNISKYNETTDLTKTEIIIPKTYSLDLMKTWIQVELKDKLNKKYFPGVKIVESSKTENETLHALFFKNAELTVVREGTFIFACELNPQLKRELKVIATSPNLINNFLGYVKDTDPTSYEVLTFEGLKLHQWLEGKQLLNLMQSECMHKVNLADMKETEVLINKYKKLFK